MLNLTGHDIGRYHVIEQLGRGGMATVYKAFDTRLEREVAIKVIRKEAVGAEQAEQILKRFDREAKSLAQLDHPYIVKVYDYGEYEGSPYLVMQFVSGGTLKARVGQPVQWAEAARLLQPIARALDYAHKRGIIHRDVKPANILLTQSGEPMLSDFGIAKILEDQGSAALTATGVGIGTPEYMAPEQATARNVDHRADIYSLGIVFFELVTGQKPFYADTPLAIIFKHASDPLPRPKGFIPDLPDDVEQVIFKALAKRPEDRYQDMGAFAQALEKLTLVTPSGTAQVSLAPAQTSPVSTGIPSQVPVEHKTAPIPDTSTNIRAVTVPDQATATQIKLRPETAQSIPTTPAEGRATLPKPKPRRLLPWLIAVGGVVVVFLLLAGAGIVMLLNKQPGGQQTSLPTAAFSDTPGAAVTNIVTSTMAAMTATTVVSTPVTPAPAATTPSTGATPTQNITTAPDICSTDKFGCAQFSPGQAIKLGVAGPTTGSNASFGIDIVQAVKIAIQDAGDLYGFKFDITIQDDGGTKEGGANAANEFISDPAIVAIVGHVFSSSSSTAMPIYGKAGIPMMSPSATSPQLTQMGYKVFNRVAFTDAVQGKYAAEYLYNKLGIRKLAVMHDGQTYGKGLAEIVRDTFISLGGEVVIFQTINPGEADYNVPLSAVAAKNPQAIYYGGYIAEAISLVNGMKQAGLKNVTFFGCDGTFGQDFITGTGSNGENAYAVGMVPPDSEAKIKFDTEYRQLYGKIPGELSPFSWSGYDATNVLIAAIRAVAVIGNDGILYIPRGSLINAVRNTKDYQGLTGTITCDDTGECNATGPTFYVVQNGKWVVAPK